MFPGHKRAAITRVAEATKLQFRWLCALILSFCYELPVYQLTSMDRLNPRLFDFVAGFGVLILLFHNKNLIRPANNPILKSWSLLVFWFTVCALIWAYLWFPWGDAGKFSIFYALKYIEGLLCIYLVAVIPLSSQQKHILHMIMVVGGLVVATFAVFEKLHGPTIRYVTDDKDVVRADGVLFSCLGPAYFHIATFSATACAMTFAMASKQSRSDKRFAFYGLGLYVAWPALVCGSRTGLGMVMIVFAATLLYLRRSRAGLTLAICCCCASVLSFFGSDLLIEKAFESSATVRRLVSRESRQGGNTVTSRLLYGTQALDIFGGDLYSWQGMRMPLWGGGFYAVPHSSGGSVLKYRRGYGIHNGYLFPYEQGGLVALVLAGSFFIVTFKQLRRALCVENDTDQQFAFGAWCVLLAFIPALWIGQVFWLGFSTENFNTFIVIIFVLAIRQTASQLSDLPRRIYGELV